MNCLTQFEYLFDASGTVMNAADVSSNAQIPVQSSMALEESDVSSDFTTMLPFVERGILPVSMNGASEPPSSALIVT